MMLRRPNASRGQAAVEFLLLATVLVIALFLPYVDGRSVVSLLLQALMECFRAQSFVISIL